MTIELALPSTPAHPKSRPESARADRVAGRLRRRIHVLVVDEMGVIRDALCALLTAMPEVGRVSSAATGPAALRSAASLRLVPSKKPSSDLRQVAYAGCMHAAAQPAFTFHSAARRLERRCTFRCPSKFRRFCGA